MATSGRDIFNRVVNIGKPLAAESTRLLLPDLGNEDQLIQNFASQYQQNVNRLWEVGSSKTYFIAGRTQGQIQIKRVLGGKGVGSAFIAKYADVCNIQNTQMSIKMEAGCDDSSMLGVLTFKNLVITSIGYSVAASDMLINEDFSLLFASLDLN